ncbi:MAG: hypothetical protein DME91_07465 [Verrucomicrobia bacterium]|nr:MAG: hypothetical protein DME91_07465 [Verrucomicrobiota bacterium]
MFLAFPDLSLPRRLLQLARRGGRNTFGGTPHSRDEAGTIASHFWPFIHFFEVVVSEMRIECQDKEKTLEGSFFRRQRRTEKVFGEGRPSF